MGNPIITRLGVNQFWYRHWYSDKFYASNLQQDHSLETLVSIYLKYGLVFKNNPFIHEYWYKSNMKNIRTTTQLSLNNKWFRRSYYSHSNLSIEHSYLIRHKTVEYFPMRTWVLKYSGWIIFSVQWFKPVKKKVIITKAINYLGSIHLINNSLDSNKRLKLLIIFILTNLKKDSEYLF
jgi:hypothetical protein